MSLGAFAVAMGVIATLAGFTAFFGAPYLPSRRRDIRAAFTHLYPLTAQDTVVDLGSGDGVVLRVAREFGARTYGYELHPVLTLISWVLARGDRQQTIMQASYWRAALPAETTVVYAFSDGRDIKRMYILVQQQATRLGRPLHFISLGFEVPGQVATKTYGAYFLYTVPPCSDDSAYV